MSRVLFAAALLALPTSAGAQATNPPYIAQFPTVDKVVKAMEMPDPRESALRKLGALWQLQEVIRQLSGRREFRGLLPDEAKVLGEYQVAEYYIGKAIDSAFPGPYGNAGKVSLNTPYRYMRTDVRFGIEGVELAKVLPVPVLEAFYQSVGNDRARRAAVARADSESTRRAEAQAGPTKLEQEQAAMRRCAESGRSQTQCMMEGIGKSFTDMVTSAVPGLGGLLNKDPIYGIRMGGVYPGTNKLSFTFFAEYVTVGCADLEQSTREYTTAIVPDGVRITISSEPRPIVLTMRADGRLAGAGPTDITGQVVVGYEQWTRTWSDGRVEPYTKPVYATFTRSCNIGSLVAAGPSPAEGTASNAIASVMGVLGGSDANVPKPTPAGLRMGGEYGTQAALDIEFRPEGAVLGCGPVAALKPYTVAFQGGRVVVNIANGASPLALAVGTDGKLSGSGTVKVDGRQATGTNPDGSLAYVPRSATCPVGVIAPAKGQNADSEPGDARAAPAAATGNGPAFQIVGSLPAPASGGNALAGAALLLMDVSLDNVLKEAGVAMPAGSSAPRVLEQTCNGVAGQANCAKIVQAMGSHTVAQLKAD
ncbi:MAG TPA: hypothetical protein VLB00_13350, partial [Gemmatimonadales bacterium]|nr:hypothetical protein [Gemmatimonadales bacterium]